MHINTGSVAPLEEWEAERQAACNSPDSEDSEGWDPDTPVEEDEVFCEVRWSNKTWGWEEKYPIKRTYY